MRNIRKEKIEYYGNILYKAGYRTYVDPSKIDDPIVKEAMQYMRDSQYANMGINNFWSAYIFVAEGKSKAKEYAKVEEMLEKYVDKYALSNNKVSDDYSIEFINYGRTQLVYVLTDISTNKKVTILAKQPVVPFGKVKQEADYLIELNNLDKNVVAPIEYFSYKDQELYVTPYINQARCVASLDGKWGIYVPEPDYHFRPFTQEQQRIVNTCMIAKLISYYDVNKGEGLAGCKVGGGDFMLPKDWEKQECNLDDTLSNLYLIAAREKVKCSLDQYINLIEQEFSKSTIDCQQNDIVINHRGRVAMKPEEISKGIELGKEILLRQDHRLSK